MTTEDLIARLRAATQKLRRTSMPIADVAPMLVEAADTIEQLQLERVAPAQPVNVVLLEALKANHQWHQDYDEHGGYPGSDLESTNVAALALASSQPAQQPMTDDFLQPNDYRLLHRFIETTEDDESYDITKAEIKRLADLGVVQSHGFGKYSVTMFGYWVHERYWEQNPSLPLKTNADRDAEAAHGIKGDV